MIDLTQMSLSKTCCGYTCICIPAPHRRFSIPTMKGCILFSSPRKTVCVQNHCFGVHNIHSMCVCVVFKPHRQQTNTFVVAHRIPLLPHTTVAVRHFGQHVRACTEQHAVLLVFVTARQVLKSGDTAGGGMKHV